MGKLTMTNDDNKTPAQVEEDLAEIEEKADALEEKLRRAEDKHTPMPDHANDGGII